MRSFIVGLLCLVSFGAQAAGDAEKGAGVFKKCAACHSIDKPDNKIGPHLVGILGRKTASVESYAGYSDAMKAAGAKGMVWDEASLASYVAAPKAFLPGNRMSFTGLKSKDDIANLIAFLTGK